MKNTVIIRIEDALVQGELYEKLRDAANFGDPLQLKLSIGGIERSATICVDAMRNDAETRQLVIVLHGVVPDDSTETPRAQRISELP